jgi:hypothetical protein
MGGVTLGVETVALFNVSTLSSRRRSKYMGLEDFKIAIMPCFCA